MLFHVSIEANDPCRVAAVFAEIWGGFAAPFPSVIDGSWVALADDDRGTMIEVYPRGTELHQGPGAAGAFGKLGPRRHHNPTHMAMATSLDLERVCAIADREGWIAKYCKRAGRFGVIELWVEGCQMVEILTPEMQREYLDTISVKNWKLMLEQQAEMRAAA